MIILAWAMVVLNVLAMLVLLPTVNERTYPPSKYLTQVLMAIPTVLLAGRVIGWW